MRREIARKVRDHLREFPGHVDIPLQEEELELEIFEKPLALTDDEGELLAQLSPFWETVDEIAKRTGQDADKIVPLLNSLIKKLWVLCDGEGDTRKYQAHTGAVEFYMPWMTPENSMELMAVWMPVPSEEEPRSLGTGADEMLPYFRVVPRESALPSDCEIYPSESISYMINHHGDNGIAVAECICRKLSANLGSSCERNGPLEQCLFFQPFAQAAVEAGVARSITKAEAFEIIDRAREHGLIHQAYSSAHPKTICSCCPDCCAPIQGLKSGVQTHTTPMKSNFYPQVNADLCGGTLDCIKRCPMQAISYDEDKATVVVDLDLCIGCGICVESCPHGAIVLKRKKKGVIVLPHTHDDYTEIDARQRGKDYYYKTKEK